MTELRSIGLVIVVELIATDSSIAIAISPRKEGLNFPLKHIHGNINLLPEGNFEQHNLDLVARQRMVLIDIVLVKYPVKLHF
jgi:hypothetical protein